MALKAADNGQHRQKMGAALVKGGSILSTGFNKGEEHAEESALRRCEASIDRETIKGATIYVARMRRGKSRPCLKCWTILKSFGVKKVYYFDNVGDVVCEKV